MMKTEKQRGFSMIEIVVALAVLAMLFFGIAKYFEVSARTTQMTLMSSKAGFLLEEGVEAVELLRDESYAENIAMMTSGVHYYLFWDGDMWVSTTVPQKVDSMVRSFTLSQVRRDVDGNISPTGTLDPGTKKLVMTVSWVNPYDHTTHKESLERYIMNIYHD